MTITYELDLEDFKAWSGGEKTLNRIIDEGKVFTFESILEDCYPEGMTEVQLNDILRFDDEWVYEMCGIRSEKQIREELNEVNEEIHELREEYAWEVDEEFPELYEGLSFGELEAKKDALWAEDYAERYGELMERKEELEEELENI